MGPVASQITSLTIVYSTVYSDADQRKHQSSASLAFVWQMASNAEIVSIWWRHHDERCKQMLYSLHKINTLRPRLNCRHCPYDILKWIILNENVWTSLKISLKVFPIGPINNTPALVQMMAWRRPDDKPLSEPMMVRLSTNICDTRPQWVEVKFRSTTPNRQIVSFFIVRRTYIC